MNIPISIIIPVYNDENNISRCINSVLSQTYKDFECLIIDDGSTDKTSSICDDYLKKDKRIKVFHKENEGISKTRQYGIERVNGEYIYFIDSDDWIESSFVADITEKIKNKPDIIFFDYIKNYTNEKDIYKSQYPILMDNNKIIEMILEKRILSCTWNFVLKKDFINNNKVIFNKKINYGEDTLFILELMLNNPNIFYINKAYYHHFINESSYTRTNLKQKYKDRILFYNFLSDLLKKYHKENMLKNNFFPMNDKFEILLSGIFTKSEYKNIFPLTLSFFFAKKSSFIKLFLLYLAETPFYYLAKHMAVLIKHIRRIT